MARFHHTAQGPEKKHDVIPRQDSPPPGPPPNPGNQVVGLEEAEVNRQEVETSRGVGKVRGADKIREEDQGEQQQVVGLEEAEVREEEEGVEHGAAGQGGQCGSSTYRDPVGAFSRLGSRPPNWQLPQHQCGQEAGRGNLAPGVSHL